LHGICFIHILIAIQTSYTSFDEGLVSVFVPLVKFLSDTLSKNLGLISLIIRDSLTIYLNKIVITTIIQHKALFCWINYFLWIWPMHDSVLFITLVVLFTTW